MAIRELDVKIEGIGPLLQNNPQTVDRFNPFTQKMARINAKKTRRTDDDYRELQDLEIAAKIFFDLDLGIYVPATWVSSAIAANSYKTVKVSKDSIRGGVFTTAPKIKLEYRDMKKVQAPEDIVKNPDFRIKMTLRQGKVRIVKAVPIFHDWTFSTRLEFDDKIIDPDSLRHVLEHAAKYGGFGDFRPTFGRAIAEITHV